MVSKDEVTNLLIANCPKGANLDIKLLLSIMSVESGFNPLVARYEPNTKPITPSIYAISCGISVDTEKMLQSMSYGLFQLMGRTARCSGFRGMLSQLYDPATNIKWGLKFFLENCDSYVDIMDKIAAYNAGTPRKGKSGKYVNQGYVDKVYGLYSKEE